jgi:transporter family-2 protein
MGIHIPKENCRGRCRLGYSAIQPFSGFHSAGLGYASLMTLILVLVAVAAGIAVALQGQFMGAIDRAAGTTTSMFVTYGLGSVLALLLWLARRPGIEAVRQIPWYSWSAGAFGLVIVGGIGYAAPRLGLARTLVITVAAQLAAAVLIEHYGLFQSLSRRFTLDRAAGLLLVVSGVWLVLRR